MIEKSIEKIDENITSKNKNKTLQVFENKYWLQTIYSIKKVII